MKLQTGAFLDKARELLDQAETIFVNSFNATLARPERFELPTPRFVVWCSIQLSYGRILANCRT